MATKKPAATTKKTRATTGKTTKTTGKTTKTIGKPKKTAGKTKKDPAKRAEDFKKLADNIGQYMALGKKIGDGLLKMANSLVYGLSEKTAIVNPGYAYLVHSTNKDAAFSFTIQRTARFHKRPTAVQLVTSLEDPTKIDLVHTKDGTPDKAFPFTEQGIRDLLRYSKIV